MDQILLITSCKTIQQEVSSVLGLNYKISHATTAQEAREKIESSIYQLILIQCQLPDLDGYRLCALFRGYENTQITPILLIEHEKDLNPHSRAMAFSVGANDLVKIPLNSLEFLAEVASKIQFRKSLVRTAKKTARGPFHIDLEAQKAYLKKEDQSVDLDLTPIEFKMFILLTNNENQPLSREKIRHSIWGQSVHIESRSIDKHVSSLRKKIVPFEDCIQTTPGLGYSFSFCEKSPTKNSAQ